MANKERKNSESQEDSPKRLGRLSMEGLDVEDALKGAIEVTPPERDPQPGDDVDDGDTTADD